jgi:hypothetical protein
MEECKDLVLGIIYNGESPQTCAMYAWGQPCQLPFMLMPHQKKKKVIKVTKVIKMTKGDQNN